MPGVRIRHATERSCTYVIVDQKRPYTAPVVCIACGVTHTFKTYHLTLDGNGAGIVSPEIAAKLGSFGPQTGFTVMNEVATPPAILIGINAPRGDVPSIIVNPHLKEPGRG